MKVIFQRHSLSLTNHESAPRNDGGELPRHRVELDAVLLNHGRSTFVDPIEVRVDVLEELCSPRKVVRRAGCVAAGDVCMVCLASAT